MNKQIRIYAIMILLLVTIFTVACTAQNNAGTGNSVAPVNTQSNVLVEDKSPIKIGVMAVMSGDAASYGLAAKQGLDFAVDEINTNGGIDGRQIELIYEDTAHDSKQAVSIMNKFISIDKIGITILADGSGPAMAVAPVAEDNKIVMIATLASTPELSDAGDYIFRTVPSDSYQGFKLTEFAQNHAAKKAAVLFVNDPYGTGIKNVFEKSFSGETIDTESFQDSATDFRTELTKIKESNPDVIVIVARSELPDILKQIKELGIKSILIGSETTKNDDYIRAAGNSAEGFYSVFFSEPQDYKYYRKNFYAKYGKNPEGYSYYSYDAVYVLADAIEKTNSTDPTIIKDQLYKEKLNGSSGIIQFDSNGDVTNRPFDIFRVENGTFVKVN